jgi:SpoVK/Ycf46/Vps4 family AAA+-type ATPase
MSDVEDLQEFNKKAKSGPNRSDQPEVDVWNGDETAITEAHIAESAGAKMWAVYGNTYSPCEKAVDTLPPGQYTIDASQERGIFFSKKEVNLDDLMILPDSASEEVIEGIETFWKKEEHFRKFGFLWKRGVMLWGPPGSGKTSTVQLISKMIVDRGGLSTYIQNPELGARGLELMRRIEPDRPIVVILEDIDAISQRHGEADLLALLDGELQIDNVIFIATTNYPERLDKRLTNRPSRFDIVKKIGMPSEDARRVYLKATNKRLAEKGNKAELELWIKQTKQFSLAHIKELIISVEVFEIPLDGAVERLRAMMDINLNSEDGYDKKVIGFARD